MLNFHIVSPHFIFLCYVCRCRFCFHWKFVRRGCKAQYFFHLHTHERELLCLAKWAISVTHQISELKVVIPENLTIFSFSSIHCNITSSDTVATVLMGVFFFPWKRCFRPQLGRKVLVFRKVYQVMGSCFQGNIIHFYIISSVVHAFWLVLTYDLLEDRRIDDVISDTHGCASFVTFLFLP